MAIFSGEAENHSEFNGNERLTILAWPSPISFLLNRDTTSPSSFFIDSHHHVELKLSSSSLHLADLLQFLFPLVGCFRLCLRLPLCYCRRPVTLPATSINFGLQNHHHRLPLLPWSSSTPSPPSDTLLPSFSFWNRSTSVTVIKIEGSCCAKLWWLYQKLPLPSSLISGHGDGGEAAIIAALLRRSSFRNLQLSGAIHPSVPVLFCRARHVSVNPFWNLVCVDARLLCCAESLSWFSVIGVLIVIVFVSYRNYRN